MSLPRRVVRPCLLLVFVVAAVVSAVSATTASAAYSDYRQSVLGSAPLGYWPLDGGSASSVADASGHGYTLTGPGSGVTAGVAGPMAGSTGMAFNGGYVGRSYFSYNNNFAIEFWARSNRVAEREAIVSNGWVGDDNCWHGFWAAASAANAGAYAANTCSATSGLLGTSVFSSASDWHHFVVQRVSGTSGAWIDGARLSASSTQAVTLGGSFRIGGLQNGTAADSYGPFKGAISDVAFYSHTLSDADVAAHYNAAIGAPTNTTTPTVTPRSLLGPGITLRADPGTWTGVGVSYSYQWQRCDSEGRTCTDISGATAGTYTLVSDDAGHTVRVTVTATDSAGSATASSSATDNVAVQTPRGQTLYTQTILNASPLGYWPLDGGSASSVADASGHGYTLTGPGSSVTTGVAGPIAGATAMAFSGGYVGRSYFSYNNNFAIEFWARSNRVAEREAIVSNGWVGDDNCWHGFWAGANGANAGLTDANTCSAASGLIGTSVFSGTSDWHHIVVQRVSGTSRVWIDGSRLSVGDTQTITLNGGSFRIGGLQNGVASSAYGPFKGAISDVAFYNHTLSDTDVADHYNAAIGAPTNTSPPTITPASGLHVGDQLTASSGSWAGDGTITYRYQWQACGAGSGGTCSDIPGETASTHTVATADSGRSFKVVVTATSGRGAGSVASARTEEVRAAAPTNTTAPTITGTAKDGAELDASPGTWGGATPMSYTYQWRRCDASGAACADIVGRTGQSYILTGDDIGHTVRSAVTATNSDGSATVTSAATDVVVAVAPQNTAAPAVSGTALDGETLTATDGTWSGTAPISYVRQWRRCDDRGLSCTDIDGATTATYLLTSEDVGHRLRVTIVATNVKGSGTEVSGPSGTVQALPGVPAPTPLADGEVAPVADTTRFLYEGSDAVQHGVAPDTIEVERGAVIRGHVADRLGHPLAAVRVSVVDHPEFGTTATAPDGDFYMAVNGGSRLTVRMERDGYVTTDRAVDVPWADYAFIDDATMVALDGQVTDVQLGSPLAPMQVAQGDAVTDSDGTRQATLMFQPGTDATMVMPDGTTRPVIGDAHVRATEFTVGATGESAMPAPLPPQSGYTYAAEFSLDEAIAAGATSVRFSKPVISYTDNFVGFRVGSPVPAGYYDRDRAQWVASDNGRVIKVIAKAGGLADVDVTGSGTASSPAQLAALGITDAERQRLAGLYDPGDELWRVALDHFTPWDFNWPYGPPAGAVGPDGRPYGPGQQSYCAICNGSIIESENQVLGESADMVGVPQTLNYRSDRAGGFKDADRRVIRLTGSSVPTGLTSIGLIVDVAGVKTEQDFAPSPNLDYTYTWDGRDAFGRVVDGGVPMTTEVRYYYSGARYTEPAAWQRAFAQPGGAASVRNARGEVGLARQSTTTIGSVIAPTDDLGGWSFSDHHFYDASSGTLLMGDGTRVTAEAVGDNAEVVAGDTLPEGGVASFAARQPSATRSTAAPSEQAAGITPSAFQRPLGVASEADGSVLVVEAKTAQVLRIRSNGDVQFLGGTGADGYSGDGGPATAADMSPNDVAEQADGGILVAEDFNGRIRRIAPDGTISTVAGTGAPGGVAHDGDGGLATAAHIGRPSAVAVAPDGSFYIADRYNSLIRRVSSDGTIQTVVGGGTGFGGDGSPARDAKLDGPGDLAVGPDGSLYIADTNNQRIRRVSPDGRMTTVAGSGPTGYAAGGFRGDGGPATSALLSNPGGVAVDEDGTLYVADGRNARVRRIDGRGVIASIGGQTMNYEAPERFTQGSPDQVPFGELDGIAVGPDGGVLVTDGYLGALYRIGKAVAGFTASTQQLVPAPDGSEVYVFDSATGRHLETRDGLTGAVTRTFGYDGAGRLTTDTDAYGNVTHVERDADGRPTAIVGPYGQRTAMTLDAGGHLRTLTSPAGARSTFGYGTSGLLTSWADDSGSGSRFEYDADGRLTRDQNAAGGATTLTRTSTGDGRSVHLSGLGAGSATGASVQDLDSGTVKRTTTDSAGLTFTRLERPDGSVQLIDPDGTVAVQQAGADPQFGAQVDVPASEVVTTPGGRSIVTTTSREVTATGLAVDELHSTTTVNGKEHRTDYDGATRRLTETSAAGSVSTAKLDDHGRPYWQQAQGFAPVITHYDARGRVTGTEQGNRSDHYEYGADGWLSAMTDAVGRRWEYEYDADGNMVKRTSPSGAVTRFRTDATGSLVGVTPPGQPEHRLTEDALGNPLSQVAPGTSSAITNHYDENGTLTSTDRPGSGTITYRHDSGGRSSSIEEPGRTTDLHYDDGSGALRSITSSDGEGISYTYDGPLLTGEHTSGVVPGTFTYGFDDMMRIGSSTIDGDASVEYAYDDDDALTRAGRETLGWDADTGQLTRLSAGGVGSTLTYDDRGYLASAATAVAGGDVLKDSYDRDADGRVTALHERFGTTTHDFAYTYDATGRLLGVRRDGATWAAYTYDANGNRLTASDPVSGGARAATFDGADRMLTEGDRALTYDGVGQLERVTNQSGGTTTYGYDAVGNLVSADRSGGPHVTYDIGVLDHPVTRKVDGTVTNRWLWSAEANGPSAELGADGAVTTRYIYGERTWVPDLMRRGGHAYRLVQDQLGSVRMVVDVDSGNIVQELDYDPYGRVLRDTNPGFQPFGYAGGLYDHLTGLVRFGQRYYDAELGRWTTPDPLGFSGDDTNLYAYVFGDPVNGLDPSGMSMLQAAADCSAGFADEVTMGATGWFRKHVMHSDDNVDRSSKCYAAGQLAGDLYPTKKVTAGLKVAKKCSRMVRFARDIEDDADDAADGARAAKRARDARASRARSSEAVRREKRMLDSAAERTGASRWELGDKVEALKDFKGIPNDETLSYKQIMRIAREMASEGRSWKDGPGRGRGSSGSHRPWER